MLLKIFLTDTTLPQQEQQD